MQKFLQIKLTFTILALINLIATIVFTIWNQYQSQKMDFTLFLMMSKE